MYTQQASDTTEVYAVFLPLPLPLFFPSASSFPRLLFPFSTLSKKKPSFFHLTSAQLPASRYVHMHLLLTSLQRCIFYPSNSLCTL